MLRRKKAFYIALIIVTSSFAGCDKSNVKGDIKTIGPVSGKKDSVEQDGNWMYLTREQRLKDFDYLHQELKENYPYFEVVKRNKGIDLDEQYKVARRR